MINVMIVDDHTILRKGIQEILSHAPDIGIVSEAATGFEAISLLRQNEIDVVVLDIEMPGRSGIEVLKDIADEERVHAGEFLRLLSDLAPDEAKFYAEGAKEVAEEIEKSK